MPDENQNSPVSQKISAGEPDNHIRYFAPKILWTILGVLLLVVIIGSVYWWQEVKKEAELSKQQAVNSNQNATADWKTYTNTEYGFEFKYPSDWSIAGLGTKGDIISVYKEGQGSINSEQLENYNDYLFALGSSKKENITVNGLNLLKVIPKDENGSQKEEYIFKQSNNSFIRIQIVGNTSSRESLHQILSTFKFIEPIPADWKTYTNTEYGFEFKYPNNWEIQVDPDGIGFMEQGINYELETPLPLVVGLDNTNFLDLQEWFDDKYKSRQQNALMPSKVEILIGNSKAFEIDDPLSMGGSFYEYVILKDNLLLRLQFFLDKKEIDQILSTFKFTK